MSWESIGLPPISKSEEHPQAEHFKAKDKKGNVYQVRNPRKLQTYTDKEGRIFVKRPKPVLMESAEKTSKRRSDLF